MTDPLGRRLKGLSDRKAPASLSSRVLAAAAARERRPWWSRAWWTWPAPARLGYGAAVAAAAVALVRLGGSGLEALTPSWLVLESPELFGPWGPAAAVARALWLLIGDLRPALLAAAFMAATASVAGSTALYRLTAAPHSRRAHP